MSRPIRLQFPGALYHVSSRGDRRALIYVDQNDRLVWLSILGEVCSRYNFVIHGFCQMSNHYHLVVQTVEGNLSRGMQQLNGLYSQYFNRRHHVVGHLFQGRYHCVLVQQHPYLLELTRYVVLNPVRARMVGLPDEWPWSSYPYIVGLHTPQPWLDIHSTLNNFGAVPADAIAAYRQFVIEGIGAASPLANTRHQLILGDDEFVASMRRPERAQQHKTVARQQRRALALALEDYVNQSAARNEAMARAFASTAYTMEQIAAHFGLSAKTVSRAIKKYRAR
ncbi:transposase [Duganella sp. BuS-21]|uniref:transposase n=1 Tax=Duganella sp. BuS-21 TaxID=2943848 RepID=UPI0035A7113D